YRCAGRAVGRCRLQGPGANSASIVRLCDARTGNGEISMRQSFQKFDELRELLNALCEETITAPQMKHLEGLVLSHPEAEAYYVQYMNLYADLAGHFTGLPGMREQYLRGRGTGEQPPGDNETGRREGRRSGDFVASLSSIVRPGRRGRFLFWGS